MKLAIPIFNNRVSPRFEFAPSLLIVSLEGDKIAGREELALSGYDLFQRSQLLRDLEVDLLICGGIQCFSRRMLDWGRIRVIGPVSGEVEEVLAEYLQGTRFNASKTLDSRKRARCCKGIGRARGVNITTTNGKKDERNDNKDPKDFSS